MAINSLVVVSTFSKEGRDVYMDPLEIAVIVLLAAAKVIRHINRNGK